MRILFSKSKWEMWDDSVEDFVRRAKQDGFDATELYFASVREPADEIAALHREHGLALVGQILTQGDTADDHLRSLDEQFEFAMQCGPILINNHAGRDIFSFEDNLRIFQRMIDLSMQSGIALIAETHRGRPTYSAIETRRYLEALPELRLTADFSHWMVVHESDLSDQQANVELAIRRSLHIHARVGYEEGPQVPDPRAPEWKPYVDNHLSLWKRIVEHQRASGVDVLTITPEFGPPRYMHTAPFTDEPVADTWEVNVYMRNLLASELDIQADA
ncbi:MAG TPA: TIM barrel protein [Rhodothermales bacterium]|nr:TIM barrel protein [Rhodothermales bacterium]